ncbi:hypothetical protein OH77DRAFT_1000217 [Trametes cingulata]|nr:hypothetical protein OH77DRAFT_1000217 [Trametes cingulata]
MRRLLVPPNDTIVVCLGIYAVQISCKAEGANDIDTIGTYYLVQQELSDLILRIVGAHILAPVPSSLVFEGERYMLLATNTPWHFGKKVAFFWGTERLKVCKDKWTFHFRTKRHVRAGQEDQ